MSLDWLLLVSGFAVLQKGMTVNMIFDHISNLGRYTGTNKNIQKFIDYMAEHDVTKYKTGRYDIDEDVYFNVKEYVPKDPVVAGWETHKEHIDIQYLLEGSEQSAFMPACLMEPISNYDPVKDKISYKHNPNQTLVQVKPGMFAIFFPEDAHRASLSDGTSQQNRKIVVKVKV